MSSTGRSSARSIAKLIFILQTLAIFGWLILALKMLNAIGFENIMDIFDLAGEMDTGDYGGEGSSLGLTEMVMLYQGFAKMAVLVLQYFFWLAFGWNLGAKKA